GCGTSLQGSADQRRRSTMAPTEPAAPSRPITSEPVLGKNGICVGGGVQSCVQGGGVQFSVQGGGWQLCVQGGGVCSHGSTQKTLLLVFVPFSFCAVTL